MLRCGNASRAAPIASPRLQNNNELHLSPYGGEGQGEGVIVVTAQTFRLRTEKERSRQFARTMRRQPTVCEKRFWWLVKDRRLGGYKFKRQVLIGSYIADFVCVEQRLIVELDGSQYDHQRMYDVRRDAFLQSKGYRVMRIWDSEFFENIDGAMDVVLRELNSAPSPLPSPPMGARGLERQQSGADRLAEVAE